MKIKDKKKKNNIKVFGSPSLSCVKVSKVSRKVEIANVARKVKIVEAFGQDEITEIARQVKIA